MSFINISQLAKCFPTTKACFDEGVAEMTFCSFQVQDLMVRETWRFSKSKHVLFLFVQWTK